MRELAERGVLRGEPGAYISTAEVAEVSVPATLQATIAARIDRLPTRSQTHVERGGGHRLAVQPRPADRSWASNPLLPTWWRPSSSIRSDSPANPSMCFTIR